MLVRYSAQIVGNKYKPQIIETRHYLSEGEFIAIGHMRQSKTPVIAQVKSITINKHGLLPTVVCELASPLGKIKPSIVSSVGEHSISGGTRC